jgi:hypothetical protein
MINPFIFLKKRLSGLQLFDDMTLSYTLRQLSMTTPWTNAVLKLRRLSDGATAYVFFDGSTPNSTITLNSLISTTSNTTPGATTLGTWIGTTNGYVEEHYAIYPNNTIGSKGVQTSTGNQRLFISSGTILQKNGTPYMAFSSTTSLIYPLVSALDSGNTFTIFSVSHNDANNENGAIMSTREDLSERFAMFNDRRTNKIHSVINGSGVVYIVSLLTQINSSDQRLNTTRVTSSTEWIAYYNGVEQEVGVWAGTYGNDILRIGSQLGNQTKLIGSVQELIIVPNTTINRGDAEDDINSYYSIYP